MKLDEPFQLSAASDIPSGVSIDVRVNLPDITELGGMPKEGEITFQFKRGELRLRDGRLSADLILSSIVAVKDEEKEEGEDDDKDIVDKLFAEAEKSESEKE